MMFTEDYPNIPVQKLGGAYFVDPKNLPNYLYWTINGSDKSHIVYEKNLSEAKHRAWKVGVGLCGRETKRITHEKRSLSGTCSDCLSELNRQMERMMFDEWENQWYDPVKNDAN